jgi:predicted  nucleic acid-binding Zn-ribbon protein
MGGSQSKEKTKSSKPTYGDFEGNERNITNTFRKELQEGIEKNKKYKESKEYKEQNELEKKKKSLKTNIINYQIKIDRYIDKQEKLHKHQDKHNTELIHFIFFKEELIKSKADLLQFERDIGQIETLEQYNKIMDLFNEIKDEFDNLVDVIYQQDNASGLKRKNLKSNITKKNFNKYKKLIKNLKTKVHKIKINGKKTKKMKN